MNPLHVLPLSVPRCPDGMVEASPCTAWSDLKCVHQESGIQASGEAPVSGEPVTTNPWPPTAPSPSSGNPWLVMGIVVGAVGVVLLLVVTAYYYRKRVLQGEMGGGRERCWQSPPPSLLLCFSRQKAPPLPLPNPRSFWPGSDLVPGHHPPSPTSPAPHEGRDHISPHFGADGHLLSLAKSRGPGPVLCVFRAPSPGREVVSSSIG